MADELSKLWEDLSLTEVEDDELCIQNDGLEGIAFRGRACILGKLIANRMICRETLRTTMIRLWKSKKNVSFKILGENLFLINFECPGDKERALKGRPWVFEGSLFLIEDFDGLTPPSNFTFDRKTFWVQMINLGCQ
jgi:hypothetical protein